MKRLDKKVEIDEEDWILIRDHLIDMIVSEKRILMNQK